VVILVVLCEPRRYPTRRVVSVAGERRRPGERHYLARSRARVPMTPHSRFFLVALLGAATWSSPVEASQRFPVVVQSSLGLAKAPPCTLCHQTDRGGENTTTQPFGRTVQRFGAVKKNDASLVHALEQANEEGTDSDGDCVPDIDELVATPPEDPNKRTRRGDAGLCALPEIPPIIKTGCIISSHGRTEFVTAVYCACLAVLVCRRGVTKIVRRKIHRRASRLNGRRTTVVPSSQGDWQ
jgi:hypothetical protein